MNAIIPFAGFYETRHDDALDCALEGIFQDTRGEPNRHLVARACNQVSWREVFRDYAREYVERFSEEFKINLMYEDLDSPREYNFLTDRIFVLIPTSEVRLLHRTVPRHLLDKVAKEEFTSHSGFASSYDPDVSTWGSVDNWDHNQVYALICAHVEKTYPDGMSSLDELDLMEPAVCNGKLDEWIFNAGNQEFDRLVGIADYLRRRQERLFRSVTT